MRTAAQHTQQSFVILTSRLMTQTKAFCPAAGHMLALSPVEFWVTRAWLKMVFETKCGGEKKTQVNLLRAR